MDKPKASSSEVHTGDSNGNHFDATKSSSESGSHIKDDKSNVSASKGSESHVNAKQGESSFDASKSSFEKGEYGQSSSIGVSASKGKDGSKFDASKTSNEFNGFSQGSESNVSAKKGGSSFDAIKKFFELGEHSKVLQALLVPRR
ncbi:17390_t:CDS:2 [Gigaspora rosea]|nr:17390_t:CDS:2 [Gigaspora rosea]